MTGHKHFIRIDEAGTIVHGFSNAFEQPLDDDILVAEEAPRHFHEIFSDQLTNECGQYRFKWAGEIVERTQAELDAEWASRPPALPTESQLLREENTMLQLALADLGQDQELDKTATQLALAEIAEIIAGGA